MPEKHEHVGEFTIDRATGEERCDECDPALKTDPAKVHIANYDLWLKILDAAPTAKEGGPPGPGRCWVYSNSNYAWQVAKDLDELRELYWVKSMLVALAPSFHQLSVSPDTSLRAPWDASGVKTLMLECDGGYKWYVLGGLESPELYGLPEWTPKYK